jgi:NAD-dependent deacetylase
MNIFVLTGAGVSAESGLGTFRDKDGLWARFDPMKLTTPEAFGRAPDPVHAFYNMRRQNLLSAELNAAHRALARLRSGEQRIGEQGVELLLQPGRLDRGRRTGRLAEETGGRRQCRRDRHHCTRRRDYSR